MTLFSMSPHIMLFDDISANFFINRSCRKYIRTSQPSVRGNIFVKPQDFNCNTSTVQGAAVALKISTQAN